MGAVAREPLSYGAFRHLTNRGARIRTGDLCDPNAALYRTEPRPEHYGYHIAARLETHRAIFFEDHTGSNPTPHWAFLYGRGGIRTHAGYAHTISNRAP